MSDVDDKTGYEFAVPILLSFELTAFFFSGLLYMFCNEKRRIMMYCFLSDLPAMLLFTVIMPIMAFISFFIISLIPYHDIQCCLC